MPTGVSRTTFCSCWGSRQLSRLPRKPPMLMNGSSKSRSPIREQPAIAGKQRLMAQIRAATTQADVALYEMRDQREGLEAWTQSHVPFHWFAEFRRSGNTVDST